MRPLLPRRVAVRDLTGEDISDGLDAAVRMPGEAGEIIRRILVTEIVEQQERIELVGLAEAEGALELDAGALDGGLGFKDLFHGTKRHGEPPVAYIHLMQGRYSLQQVICRG